MALDQVRNDSAVSRQHVSMFMLVLFKFSDPSYRQQLRIRHMLESVEESGDRARRLKSELDVMWPELWICTGDQHTGDKLFKTPEIDSKPRAQGQESRLGSQNWEFSVGKIRMRTKRIRMRTVWEHVKVDMKEPQTLSKVHGKPDLRSLA